MKNFVSMTFEYTRAAPQAYGIGAVLKGNNQFDFGPMISGESSIVGKEIIPNITLHSYSGNHYGVQAYDTPAVSLPDNVYNPWGRPGDRMHGADPTPIVVGCAARSMLDAGVARYGNVRAYAQSRCSRQCHGSPANRRDHP